MDIAIEIRDGDRWHYPKYESPRATDAAPIVGTVLTLVLMYQSM